MPMIPLYIQPQQGTATAAGRISAFNFCNPFDHVLPIPDGSVSAADRAHLWGHYSEFFVSIAATAAGRISAFNFCNPFDYVLPIPDGSVNAADRAHLWGHYSDVGAVATAAADIYKLIFRRRRR